MNGRINGPNAILNRSSFIDCQFIPGERPYILERNEKLTPVVSQNRGRRIDSQYRFQRSQTPAIAPGIDELLDHAE
jgi:hypothetical protein